MRTQPTCLIVLGLLAAGWLSSCSEQPTAPAGTHPPSFATVTVTDPSTVLVVDGVLVPRKVSVSGTLAGIVVTVDKADVDISNATVDCDGRDEQDEIGVWITGGRTQVSVTGGGTGTVTHCAIGILIGPLESNGGDAGGANNKVQGVAIQHSTGSCVLLNLTCGSAIAVFNSRANSVVGNTIFQAGVQGVVILGSDPSVSAAGANKIQGNTIEGFGDWGILVLTDGNIVRDNLVRGWFYNIAVDHDKNTINDNRLGYLESSCGCAGVRLMPGADDNLISNNLFQESEPEAFEAVYFWAEAGTFRNVLRGNTATLPIGLSALDESGDCLNNTWRGNTFATRDPVCIR